MLKIPFVSIEKEPKEFSLKFDKINFNGSLKRINTNLVSCIAVIRGDLSHFCDGCGEDIVLSVNENVNLLLSDGIFKDDLHQVVDLMEFFDGFIDLEAVYTSEIEAFKSDYFYCEKCSKREN